MHPTRVGAVLAGELALQIVLFTSRNRLEHEKCDHSKPRRNQHTA
jgi:hypothetical protein